MRSTKITDYDKDLSLVERFMVRSKIRRYCTRICKGGCCGGCLEPCSAKERRLPCSAHICPNLLIFISSFLGNADFRDIVMRVYYGHYDDRNESESLVDRCHVVGKHNIHYKSNLPWKKAYHTHRNVETLYNDKMSDRIRPAIEVLLKDRVKEYDLLKSAKQYDLKNA